jgi:hypothetical protein
MSLEHLDKYLALQMAKEADKGTGVVMREWGKGALRVSLWNQYEIDINFHQIQHSYES